MVLPRTLQIRDMTRALVDTRDAPTKQHRRSTKGCITCRIRRVKCDEGHPSCTRCTSTGRKCEYYQVEKQTPHAAYLMVIPRSPPPQARHIDLKTFDYFHKLFAPTLLNYGGEQFWNRRLLQACQHDKAINHLVMATTGVWFRGSNVLSHGVDSPGTCINYLSHYGKALAILGRTNRPDPGVILMACLILMLCDELQQNRYGALRHLMSGRKIITSYLSRRDGCNNDIIDELVPIFSELELHTGEIYHITMAGSPEILKSRTTRSHVCEEVFAKFENVDEAVDVLYRVAVDGTSLQLDGMPPVSQFHVVPNLTLRLNDWLFRFSWSEVGSAEERQILRLYHSSLDTLSRCAPFNNESAFDMYLSSIEQLLIVCNRLLFSTTTGLVPVLFFVATRYRSASVRRRAIELLRFCGMDGRILASIAMKVVRIEESRVSEPVTSADVPEEDRIRLVGLHTGSSAECLLVDYRRRPYREPKPIETVLVPIRRLSLAAGDFDPMHTASLLRSAIEFDFLDFWCRERS